MSCSSEPEVNRYNVLFIAVDDLRPDLGFLGVERARTPSLDRFAESATTFERHFVQVPTCGASRYALLTGRSPLRSGVTARNDALYAGGAALSRGATAGAQTLPELFRRSGYRTACIGKISHTPDGRVFAYDASGSGRPELPHAWDALLTPFGPWRRGWGAFFAYAGGIHREDGGGHDAVLEFVAEADDDLPDGLLADAAIDELERLAEGSGRWFLGLGFYKPHLPFVATRGDLEALEGVDCALDPALAAPIDSPHRHRSGEFFRYSGSGERRAEGPPLGPEDTTRMRRAYAACVRYVDRQIGRVLDALEAQSLADDTIVVVWGDHGWHLGEQGMWGKHSPFERALKSALMIRVPGRGAGRRTRALAASIDLFPTLVELCRPAFRRTEWPLDGTSLVPLVDGTEARVQDAVVSCWRRAASVRTDRHRLVVSRTALEEGQEAPAGAELYDMGDGPRAADGSRHVSADRAELTRSILVGLREARGR